MTMRSNTLTIDAKRVWSDLVETAQTDGTAKGGIPRLTLGGDKQSGNERQYGVEDFLKVKTVFGRRRWGAAA